MEMTKAYCGCMYCDAPATYQNITQFAGTHYYCTAHAMEQPDCEDFSYIINPDDVKTKIVSSTKNTQAIELFHIPTAITILGEGRSQHKARDDAWDKLNQSLQKLMAMKPLKVCQSPYCECLKDQCKDGLKDMRGQYHYQKIVDDTIKDLQQTTIKAKERVVDNLRTQIETSIKTMNQQYLLDKLQEEAAEIIQAVSKIRRFGPNNHHPDRTTTNLEELVGELEDLQAIVLALEEIKYLDPKPSTIATIKKFNTLISS
jgi:uncharacterized membrane-anchored protein YjiN (DUF445 family)